ncbi:MAG: hypothetical protein QNK37_01730 [Acidobacteriota bacterium]|nr:hypothetical protein [Acidobacteriota bacterium]
MKTKHGLLVALSLALFPLCLLSGDERAELQKTTRAALPGSSFTITNDEVAYNNQGIGYTDSTHQFDFHSNGEGVDNIELTFFDPNGVSIVSYTALFTDYTDLNYTKVTDASGTWHNFSWVRGGNFDVFDNEPMLEILLRNTDCRASTDVLTLAIQDNSAESMLNVFNTETMGIRTPDITTDGERSYLTPVADMTLWSEGMTANGVVAGGCVGCDVTVDLNLRDLTFGYDSFEVTVCFDDELNFQSFTRTISFSYNGYVTSQTDTCITITSLGFTFADSPPRHWVLFGQLNFTIDPAATAGSLYEVRIDAAEFDTNCTAFGGYIDPPDAEKVYVEAEPDMATWKVDSNNFCSSSGLQTLDFFIKTNAPITTGSETGKINASFSIDTSALGFTTVTGVNSGSYGGGTIYWRLVENPDEPGLVTIEEDPQRTSTVDISPGDDFQKIGELVIDVGSTVGTDVYAFAISTPPPPYLNYVRTGVNDNLLTSDGTQLAFVNGSVNVITCSGGGGGGGGCQAVYTAKGTSFVLQDYVLTHDDAKFGLIDDYLVLTPDLKWAGDELGIQIRELGDGTTDLDQVSLLVVDYPADSGMGVSADGSILTHRESFAPVSAVDENGKDLLSVIGNLDGRKHETGGPGSMILTFEKPDTKDPRPRLGFTTGELKKVDCGVENPVATRVSASIESQNGKWYDLGRLSPREDPDDSNRWIWDEPHVPLGKTFRVRLDWEQGYAVDGLSMLLDDGAKPYILSLPLVDARHSIQGLSTSLHAADNRTLRLTTGEMIELAFRLPTDPAPQGYRRAYILKTRGTALSK